MPFNFVHTLLYWQIQCEYRWHQSPCLQTKRRLSIYMDSSSSSKCIWNNMDIERHVNCCKFLFQLNPTLLLLLLLMIGDSIWLIILVMVYKFQAIVLVKMAWSVSCTTFLQSSSLIYTKLNTLCYVTLIVNMALVVLYRSSQWRKKRITQIYSADGTVKCPLKAIHLKELRID